MNCDSIAWVYQACEYLAFGRALEKRRRTYLSALAQSTSVLLLGDGDGRFLNLFAARNRRARIDSIDLSPKMLEQSGKRLERTSLGLDHSRIRLEQADALTVSLSGLNYDAVVTHFFLDCFSTEQVDQLVRRVTAQCKPGALWIVSEFNQPTQGWRAWHARCWLRLMYTLFGLATGLETKYLPDYKSALIQAGFTLRAREWSRAELLCSEMWTLR